MILVIDVGNTNIVLGAYEGKELINRWRMTTRDERTSDETGIFISNLLAYNGLSNREIEGVIISSVVPDVMYSLRHGIRKYFNIEPLNVSARLKTGINICTDNPKELGADRITNCVAAYELYGGPIIVIDYGTATTYDVVNDSGEFIAGVTAPGIRICADALYEKTALLSKVEIELPKSILAKNTTNSIQAGLVYGHIGETEYIVKKMKEELGRPDAKVVATGGLARVFSSGTEIFDYFNPELTLEGLCILYHKNSSPNEYTDEQNH